MKLLHLFFIFLFLIIFNGCGSDGTSSTNKTKIGFFVDSLVDGVEYQCGDINGITGDVNGKGSFRYQEDCSVKFNIGKMYLGEVSGDDISNTNSGKKVFITNILGLNTTDTSDVRLWNILRLLQTLDTDDNLSNGILISNTVRDNLNRTDVNSLDFTQTVSVDELNSTVIKADSNKNLRTITQALTHFEAKLAVDTVGPPTPFLTKDLTKIKTIHTIKRTVEINGEEGSKIFLGFNSDGNNSNINFKDQNLTINSTWKQKLSLTFNDDNITNFHYYIILQDNKEHNSSILHLNILKDFTPPHVKSAIIIKHVIEEQRLFENIFATDNSGMDSIKYKIVTSEEDNNSFDYTLFTIDINGSVTFLENPNYEENIGRIYQIVARAIDTSGNMTDVIIQVSLINILDNPPKLNANNYNTAMIEGEANNFIVYDLNSTLEENLTIAQDNDPTLSPISFLLHNHTDIFDLNISTGKLTIKDNTNALFDYEQSPNSIDLNISVENNNTKVARNGDLNATYTILTIDINNKIDTPPSLISPNSVLIDERNDPGIIDIVTISKDTANSDRNLSMLFSIVNGADGKFDINSTTGLIKTNGDNLDFETKPQYILTIRAINIWEWDNNSTHYDEVNLTINLNNVIDNPPIIIYKDLNNSIPESTPINFQIAQLETNGTIYDENQTTSYQIKQITKNGSILNIDTAPFTIDSNGIVSTSRELLKDYIETLNHLTDTVFNFQLNAYNIYWNGEQNTSNIVSFDINITNVIDNFPILKQAADKTFEENISVGTIVNTVETNSDIYDENNVTRFSIKSGNDDNIFNINNTTGEIKIQNPLDWETTISYTLEVIASNIYFDSSEHNSSTMFFDIAITNIIEKVPQITTLTSIDVHENIDADFTISVLETNSTQVDEQTIDSFTIISGNDGNFSLDSTPQRTDNNLPYGELKISDPKNINYDENNSYILKINATNSFGSSTHTVNINIIDDVDTDVFLLILEIEYDDINFTTSNIDIENLIFSYSDGGTYKSLTNYLLRISKNKFKFQPASETYDNDTKGIIKIKLSGDHPKDGKTALENDIVEALNIADNNCDFSDFDKNNDGNISNDELQILLIISGDDKDYLEGNHSINPINGILTDLDNNLTLDGVKIKTNYTAISELINTKKTTIGLIAKYISKELFKFKDDGNTNYKYDYFGLMGTGYEGHESNETIGKTPVHPSIFNKMQQGWVTPNILKSGTTTDMIFYNTHNDTNFNTIRINSNDLNIYYLIENRNQTDDGNKINYDNGLYGKDEKDLIGGLIIWEINNNDNTIKMVPINNSENNIFTKDNAPNDIDLNNIFEFTGVGSQDEKSKQFTIQIEVK